MAYRLYAARTRQDAEGKPASGWYPNERLRGEEALEGFTVGAGYAGQLLTAQVKLTGVTGAEASLAR